MLTPSGQYFDWRNKAACSEGDAEMFFSEKATDQRQAKEICSGCYCRAECLATAMLRGDNFGIWGGMTPAERSRHKARWRRRMGGGAMISDIRQRSGLFEVRGETGTARRYEARRIAAEKCRAILSTMTDLHRRDEFLHVIETIRANPEDHSRDLARRAGMSQSWFNQVKRQAFDATGIDESSFYTPVARKEQSA